MAHRHLHEHGHAHAAVHAHPGRRAGRPRAALLTALAISGGFLVVEAAAALRTGSLALAADAGHMLADVGGLALALFAARLAARPPTPRKTYGYHRAEILAAVVNALVLLALSGVIVVEAYRRVWVPHEVPGGAMLVVALLGLLANAASAVVLHREASASVNVRAAYLEVLADGLSSLGVLGAALVILLTGWTGADSVVSVAIALFVVVRTWRLLVHLVNILLEGTPPHLDLEEIEAAMLEVSGVRRLHDLHVWTLTSGREAMSAHVVVDDVRESERLLEALHAVLHARFGIDHTTIQLETEPPAVLRIRRPPPEAD